jgi:hypothetical protein
MASNQLPDSIYDLFTLAEDLANGAHIRGGGLVLVPGLPKVARASQPWAGGHNPFGIGREGVGSK